MGILLINKFKKMKTKNLKAIFLIVNLALVVLAVSSMSSFTSKAITPYTSNNEEGQWKNLKVLPQDISKDSLMNLMRGYNKALGVKCVYCHVPKKKEKGLDFVSDEKQEKEYARHMILMTRKINAEHFNWGNSDDPERIDHVKCVTCHYGHAKPTEHLKNIGSFYKDDE